MKSSFLSDADAWVAIRRQDFFISESSFREYQQGLLLAFVDDIDGCDVLTISGSGLNRSILRTTLCRLVGGNLPLLHSRRLFWSETLSSSSETIDEVMSC